MTSPSSPSFEDRIMGAIVDRFFAPHTVYAPVQIYDGATNTYRTEWSGVSQKSPVQAVAEEIFTSKKSEIMSGVLEKLTLEMIVEALVPLVAADVVTKLQPDTGGGYYSRPQEPARDKMRTLVWDKVAEEFGKQAVAYLQRTGGLQPVLGAVDES